MIEMEKNTLRKIAFDLIFHLAYIFLHFGHAVPLKKFAGKKITAFLSIFVPIKLEKGYFFNFEI